MAGGMLYNKNRTRKGLASALPGSGPKLVEDADALVLQETLTRFGLNSHHQRDLDVLYSTVRAFRWQTMDSSVTRFHQRGPDSSTHMYSCSTAVQLLVASPPVKSSNGPP